VALVVVGGVLGVTGVFGHPAEQVTVAVNSILMPPTVQAEACPGGPVVASVERGSRVVAIARTADSAQVQVRNPQDVSQLVWVATSQVDADTGEGAVSTLPIGPACPTLFVAQAPVVVPVTPVVPSKPGKPVTPVTPDTTPPSVTSVAVLTNENCHVIVTAAATDDVGVSSATVVLSGVNTGSHAMTFAGGHWQFVLQQPPVFSSGSTTFTVTVKDAAGNTSSKKSTTVSVQCVV
jgi:hypothetical protein